MPLAQPLKQRLSQVATWTLVVLAACCAYLLYCKWTARPWTRDGQVRANIIQLTPQVAGNLVRVAVRDNQLVEQGDLLFEIDASPFQLAVENAQVALDQSRETVASLAASVQVAQAEADEAAVGVTSARRNITLAEARAQAAQAAVTAAQAGVSSAEQLIKQRQAELTNARSEANRAKRLLDKKAGSIEDAESTAATSLAQEAQLASARSGRTQAQASLTQAEASLNEANVNRLLATDGLAQAQAAQLSAQAALQQAQATLGTPGEQNVRVRAAKISLANAKLNLSYTKIVAPCTGYISNLAVESGDYAVVGQPLLVLVDRDSFRVHAYFQETKLRSIQPGDRAVVTLMSHPDAPIPGEVESIGSAVNPPDIAPSEGQPGQVPQIAPTFDWVRLPQRVPVRIRLLEVPPGMQLISGTTASVAVRSAAED